MSKDFDVEDLVLLSGAIGMVDEALEAENQILEDNEESDPLDSLCEPDSISSIKQRTLLNMLKNEDPNLHRAVLRAIEKNKSIWAEKRRLAALKEESDE